MTPHEAAFAERLAQYRRMVAVGSVDPDCLTCQSAFGTENDPRPETMHPSHGPKERCNQPTPQSHCSCDACW